MFKTTKSNISAYHYNDKGIYSLYPNFNKYNNNYNNNNRMLSGLIIIIILIILIILIINNIGKTLRINDIINNYKKLELIKSEISPNPHFIPINFEQGISKELLEPNKNNNKSSQSENSPDLYSCISI